MAKRTVTIPDRHWRALEIEASRLTAEALTRDQGTRYKPGDVLRLAVSRYVDTMRRRKGTDK